ncbi:MAG: MAPEG family protein [bacterium]|nr:MAPEG family protein [bacterium]
MTVLEESLSLSPYEPAVLAFAVLCMAVMVQAFLTAPLGFLKEEQAPGMPLRGDHDMFSFRVLRTYANSVENLPAFGFSLLLAILVGVSAAAVNWLAAIHVASRLAFWAVYYSGVGKVAGGPRTITYVAGALSNLVLTGMVLYTLVS